MLVGCVCVRGLKYQTQPHIYWITFHRPRSAKICTYSKCAKQQLKQQLYSNIAIEVEKQRNRKKKNLRVQEHENENNIILYVYI